VGWCTDRGQRTQSPGVPPTAMRLRLTTMRDAITDMLSVSRVDGAASRRASLEWIFILDLALERVSGPA